MKTGGLALISCCAALLLRKTNPELSFAVSAASVCALLILTLPLAKALNEMRDTMRQLYGMEDAYVARTHGRGPLPGSLSVSRGVHR